ncbi:drug/metabolite transporter (DMT)-like permease [Elusimicrobium posterum]|uniref:DMT family transporter n=1 Tax=Elusimicrobium posterum TaxID=3116653 RepID=UPI003C7778CC
MSPLTALWINLFVTALWPIAGKAGGEFITPALLVFLASVISVLCFTPHLTKNKLWGKLFDKKLWKYFLVMGVFGTAIPFTSMFVALQYTTPSNTAILNQSELLYSLVITYFMLGEKPSLSQLAGSALIISGVLIILVNEHFSPRWTGDLIVLLTPWTFQLAHATAKKLPKDLDDIFVSAARSLYGLFALVPVIIYLHFTTGLKFVPTKGSMLSLFFLGAIFYGVARPLWYKAIRNIDLSKVTAITLSYPVITLIFSALLGIEKIYLYQTIGLVMAFSGAMWITVIVKKSNNLKNKLKERGTQK